MVCQPSGTSPERALFKVLLDESAQFTAEVATKDFVAGLNGSGTAELLFAELFTKDKIAGGISMQEIMHDAMPADGRALSGVWSPF